jgi:hypothetical protein
MKPVIEVAVKGAPKSQWSGMSIVFLPFISTIRPASLTMDK